jgi:hypothetical protein
MWTLTLDHNCIINLEEHEGQHDALEQLVTRRNAGEIRVHVGWISASENVRSGEPSSGAFSERIERLGLSRLPRVFPEMRVGMSYIGECVIGGDDDLEPRVRAIVHPSTVAYEQFVNDSGLDPEGPIDRKWRNRFCDIEHSWRTSGTGTMYSLPRIDTSWIIERR